MQPGPHEEATAGTFGVLPTAVGESIFGSVATSVVSGVAVIAPLGFGALLASWFAGLK